MMDSKIWLLSFILLVSSVLHGMERAHGPLEYEFRWVKVSRDGNEVQVLTRTSMGKIEVHQEGR